MNAASTVDRHVDVLVLGAGPAGSAAAIAARRAAPSARVLLVDAKDFPRDKVCGDGLGPEGHDVLAEFGIAEQIVAGHPPVDRVRVRAPNGLEASGRAPRPGHVVPRRILDHRLRDAAVDAGADFEVARATEVDRSGRVTFRAARPVQARTVIAADGANGRARRDLGFGAQPDHRTGLAMRAYATRVPGVAEDELFIGFVTDRWPAYVWAFPTGTGLHNIGYGPFDARRIDRRADLTASLEALLPGADPDPATMRAHHLPLSTHRPPPSSGRVLLAGDAASLVHPLTGEGIYYALRSGQLAGDAAVTSPDPARTYRRALRRRLGRHLRHTTVAAAMFRSTVPVDLSVRAAANDPTSFATLCEFALGTGLITPHMVARLTREWIRGA